MEKAIIFGAGSIGEKVLILNKEKYEIIAFTDNDINKIGTVYCSLPVISPQELMDIKFDVILIGSLIGLNDIPKQLEEIGIHKRIDSSYAQLSVDSRILFLSRYAELTIQNHIEGEVAEAGVFRGEFAQYINFYFPHKRLYLFDTFEGFDDRDFKYEQEESFTDAKHISETSVVWVMNKMKYKENVIIKKGYFPDTTTGIVDQFCFVNLDMDLYKPTLEGLRFFYPKMNSGGIILIHDYFSKVFPNVKRAVEDFDKEIEGNLTLCPIGDDLSIAIVK